RTGEAFLQIDLGEGTKADSKTLAVDEPDAFDSWLDACKPTYRQKAAEKVVLFLALPGGADDRGPYLIFDGADPRKDKHRLYVKDLLDQLAQLESKTQKLVLLDPVQTTNYQPFGIIHNAFVQRLEELSDQVEKVPNLVVLCASDKEQRSWVSD